jgi:surface antigen
MKPASLAALLVALAAVGPQPAVAQQFGLLRGDTALANMTREDAALMTKNYTEALDRNPDGHTSAWTNAATGASGTATPLGEFSEKGMRCRRIEITNSARGASGRGEYRACRTRDGWKFL